MVPKKGKDAEKGKTNEDKLAEQDGRKKKEEDKEGEKPRRNRKKGGFKVLRVKAPDSLFERVPDLPNYDSFKEADDAMGQVGIEKLSEDSLVIFQLSETFQIFRRIGQIAYEEIKTLTDLGNVKKAQDAAAELVDEEYLDPEETYTIHQQKVDPTRVVVTVKRSVGWGG